MVILIRAPLLLQHIAILLWLAFILVGNVNSHTTKIANFSCIESERWALLKFKSSLDIYIDSVRNLSDWSNENMDCCRWEGIRCSKAGRVVTLDLHNAIDVPCDVTNQCIGTEISPSLLHLSHLKYLDLSSNDFRKVPEFVGSLKRLKYLNLSFNPFEGIVPHQLGNLSVLETLDLNQHYFQDLRQVGSFAWVSKLTSLKYLDLSHIRFSQVAPIDWLQSISKLPNLEKLYLQECMLITFPILTEINSSKSLEVVDLSRNSLDPSDLSPWLNASTRLVNLIISDGFPPYPYGPIPDFISKLVSIKHLHLSNNQFIGAIPETFSNLTNLLTLDLSWNRLNKSSRFLQFGSTLLQELHVDNNVLQGHLPNLSKFPSLQVLNLAQNKFRGSLEQLLWQSFNLSTLDVSSNRLYGILSDANFQNLSNLQVLSLSMNSITLNFSTSYRPPFQLRSLKLRDCKLGERFPLWLRTQRSLISLDISNSGISDVVPTWFWHISSRLQYLNASHNSIAGTIPPNSLASCYIVVLSFNRFHGPVPTFSSRELQLLDLSSNMFSGSITFLCGLQAGKLYHLDLSDNLLSGNVPNCWEGFQNLYLVNLNNNNFTGFIPNSMEKLYGLTTLSLRNNSFSGPVPQSLENCYSMFFLDFSENQFSGTVPKWIGTSLNSLGFLRLNSNKFGGKIPSTLCNLKQIRFLDLSFNNISGTIPSCLNNLKAMAQKHPASSIFTNIMVESGDIIDSRIDDFTAWIFWKGLQTEFMNVDNIELLNLIDLSSNRLTGFIPGEVTNLYELVSLNLSHNDLIGPIPDKIGEMRMLEILDLSGNQLSGKIPWSMSNLTTLSYLDLSYNDLTGSIPISTQLQTFNATMFRGNPGLCGAPLPNSCHQGGHEVDYHFPNTEGGDGNEKQWMYISIGLGFMVGFWGVCGLLLVKDSWRQRYFQILDHCKERFLVALFISLANLRRMFAT